jgi:hypothetical protein
MYFLAIFDYLDHNPHPVQTMNLQTRFSINSPNVVCEVFDREVVVVNLDIGVYYSIGGWAAQIWMMLQNHDCPSEIIEQLKLHSKDEPEVIEKVLTGFVQDLLDRGLIVADESAMKQDSLTLALDPVENIPTLGLEEFSDMQDMLLLDPVHDVDEAGWPIAKPPQ